MPQIPHYYGDKVRNLFLLGAVVMLIALPWLSKYLIFPLPISIGTIIVVGLAAGLATPRQRWIAYVNTIIAAIAFAMFEMHAVKAFTEHGSQSPFFVANQFLAFIFLMAMYYAIRTVRTQALHEVHLEEDK